MVENDVAFCFFLLRLGFSNTKQMSSSDLITVEAPSCWTVWPMTPQLTSPTFSSSIRHCCKVRTLEHAGHGHWNQLDDLDVKSTWCLKNSRPWLMNLKLRRSRSCWEALFRQEIVLMWSGEPRGASKITHDSEDRLSPSHLPSRSAITSVIMHVKWQMKSMKGSKVIQIKFKSFKSKSSDVLGLALFHEFATSVREHLCEPLCHCVLVTSTAMNEHWLLVRQVGDGKLPTRQSQPQAGRWVCRWAKWKI